MTLNLLSPAKLNLFLHINGRLPNGYHELQSLFHFLDYGDHMTFSLEDEESFICDLKSLETPDNLVIKARDALKKRTDKALPPVKIKLNKVLPMGGGVGGGSSNAATTLLALNKLWQLNLSIDELADIGLKLGADVPVFVRGNTAVADGVGEKLTPYPISEKWYLVLVPAQHVNTAELFSDPNLPRDSNKLELTDIQYQGIESRFKNDFEKLVYNRYPTVAKAIDWLLEYGPARLTGTGACVFAEFDSESQANEIFHRLPVDMVGFVAKGCNKSPTHQTLFGQ